MDIQRTFIPGDEWCYFKIYTGFKTADTILADAILPLAHALRDNNLIDKWFFIRYTDPKFHLRIRFHLNDISNISVVLLNFNYAIKEYVKNDLIWKVQMDTYNREIERYGNETMELSESYFYHDSEMIVRILTLLKGNSDEDLQWLLGLKMMDCLLNDFGYSLEEKIAMVEIAQENYKKEFSIHESQKPQFGNNYRNKRKSIETILNNKNDTQDDWSIYFLPIFEKSCKTTNIANEIKEKKSEEPPLYNMLWSYLHMMLNRFFRTQQRAHELILYDFLLRYYVSQKAQQKKLTNVNIR